MVMIVLVTVPQKLAEKLAKTILKQNYAHA